VSLRLLHFADAHIDMANYGRHDPDTGLPQRVVDFLDALDQIVDAAIDQQVDLVIFAGDAYKDRNPHPTFQREWGRRMMRLSRAHIPTIMLVGNHDVSPAAGRAHTLQEFSTLEVPSLHVADRIERLGPDELGVPIQVITLPWVSRSRLLRREDMLGLSLDDLLVEMEERVTAALRNLMEDADPDLPLVLTAHVSVTGAKWGSERAVMLGQELVLNNAIVRDKRLDYVALGHIHKHQDLNEGGHPPVVYPGSIERIDFGELREDKGYVIAEIEPGKTSWRFEKLQTRRFLSFEIRPQSEETFMEDVLAQLPEAEAVADAICRVQLTYPREWEAMLEESRIAQRFAQALSLQLNKIREIGSRARLGDQVEASRLHPLDLLNLYWQSRDRDEEEIETLKTVAQDVLFEEVDE
jgi:exonuclease SbcD